MEYKLKNLTYQDLHNIYLELQLELVKNFVAYIPTILSENGTLDDIASEIKVMHDIDIDLTQKDKLILFDSNCKIIVSPTFEEMKPFYIKNINLQKNCFKLLELSQSLSEDSFDYLYVNYLKRLNGYINASNFLLEIFENNCPSELICKQTLFVIQNDIFNTHLIELQGTVGFIYELPNNETSITSKTENRTEKSFIKNDAKSKKSPISKKEAVDYLLATVFKPKK